MHPLKPLGKDAFPPFGQCAPRGGLVCLQWKEIFRRGGHLSTFMGWVSARREEYPAPLNGGPARLWGKAPTTN